VESAVQLVVDNKDDASVTLTSSQPSASSVSIV
jgi:hypothetical protein